MRRLLFGFRNPARAPPPEPSGPARTTPGEAMTMAKGQKRSNKEVKKPKQEKGKTTTAPASTSTRLTESQERSKGSKK